MTTFQVIIDSILRALSGVIPLSYSWAAQLEEQFLHFSSKAEVEYLVTLILSVTFLIYFRFDWLGVFSALAKTLIQPKSIKKEYRTLDQEVLIFMAIVSVPLLLIRHWLASSVAESEMLNSPIAYGITFLVGFGILRFASRWNKRIKGLNHLRTLDAVTVLLVSILSLHPALPLALVFWFGFALTNYHYEAIFKYTMLLMGVQVVAHFFGLMGSMSLGTAISSIGYLNSIAVAVVCFTILWMVVENLQKNISENTLRSFQWLNIFAAISSFALHFLKG